MPAMRTPARPGTARSVVVTLVCVGVLAAMTTIARRYGFSTLDLDRAAAGSWLGGDGLYAYRSPVSHLGTALPPPAAVLTAPAAFLPLAVAGWALALAGLAALGLALVALAGPVARRYGRRRWPVVLAVGALALTIEPVRASLGLGTLDLVAFGLVTADIVALRRGAWARSRELWWPGHRPFAGSPLHRLRATGGWAGVGVGLATALTVGPAFFIAYLMLTRQWRPALTALATTATAATAAVLVTPHESAAWLGEVLWRLDRTGPVDAPGNQSLGGVFARLYDSASTPLLVWLSFAMLLVAVGLIRARSAHADGDEVTAFTLVGLTAAGTGPVTGTHEVLWMLPAMLVLVDTAARRRAEARGGVPGRPRFPGAGLATAAGLTYLLLVLAPMWSLSDAFSRNSYALAMIVLVNALPWRPAAAPAFPVNRWLHRRPATATIPPPREPLVRGS
ncbi:glycosyltransferase 87 family protein [Nucisporomicrobium flavum]|jgi:alpha-1,2-mannosyltransferase|uniref:glycosyltransferase 87 family protein n=1 Tax=Nucisporomicrobium flavum TaxID=2785915 RepID=UPI0018F5F48E|nr:glycosyltransferase 87 family protein [Nucisporomicrobium flavum]